jgi:excisionase family DNA binding protein
MKKTLLANQHQGFYEKNFVELQPMLTTGEACRVLHIHSNTLRRWSNHGAIVAYRIGPRGDRRFKREDVLGLMVGANVHR